MSCSRIFYLYLKDPTRTKAKKERKWLSEKIEAGIRRRKEKKDAKEKFKFRKETLSPVSQKSKKDIDKLHQTIKKVKSHKVYYTHCLCRKYTSNNYSGDQITENFPV